MSELRITYEAGGYRLMVSSDGRDERPHGPCWPTPREAARFFDTYQANHPQAVSPLRSAPELGPLGLDAERSGLTSVPEGRSG